MSFTSEPTPILRVTEGTPVYTQDEERVGIVKERRGKFFLVSTSILQRDYWLPGEVVRMAVPDEVVLLDVGRHELDARKIYGRPAEAA